MVQIFYDKLWNIYVVYIEEDGMILFYIDCQLLYEVMSLQVFEGLKMVQCLVWCISVNLVVLDYNVLIMDCSYGIVDFVLKLQVDMFDVNCDVFGIIQFKMNDVCQGIVYIIGLEQGVMLLGMMIVCGDLYMLMYGVFGVFVYGIGMLEVEYVFVMQILLQKKSKNMFVKVDGVLLCGCIVKDIVFVIIGKIGIVGGIGYVIEFGGLIICVLMMEGCMIVCNMVIEVGVCVGMVVVDDMMIDYLKGCLFVLIGVEWDQVVEYWCQFKLDDGVYFDCVVELNVVEIVLQVMWGMLLEMVMLIDGCVFDFECEKDLVKCDVMECVLVYMVFELNMLIELIKVDKIFIGLCMNVWIEDICVVVYVVKKLNCCIVLNVWFVMVVLGLGFVKVQVECEGFDKVFIDVGFEWCELGCLMCFVMNVDWFDLGECCVLMLNCNFEGWQGVGGCMYFVSFVMVVVVVIEGYFVDICQLG